TVPATPPLPGDLAAILDAYREIIVLLEDQRALEIPDQRRAELAGRLLYQQKHDRVFAMSDLLAADLRARPIKLDRAKSFLDVLESHPDLHDADKLAFADLVEDLTDGLPGLAGAEADRLRQRLQDDGKGLAEIQSRYQKELEAIFGRFETRGMQVRRE